MPIIGEPDGEKKVKWNPGCHRALGLGLQFRARQVYCKTTSVILDCQGDID